MKTIFLLSLVLIYTLNAEVLTLKQSIDKTLKNYPDIHSIKLKIEQSKFSYKSEFSAYLPQINLNAQYNATQTYVLPANGTFNTKDDDGFNIGATLKQKIWDFSKTSSKVDASKADKEISKLSLLDLKALLAYKVKSLYKLVILEKKSIDVHKQDLQTKKAYYEQAKALKEQGLKTLADESRFLSAVYKSKEDLAIAYSNYKKAKNSLSLYMGEKINDNTTFESKLLSDTFISKKNLQKEIISTNYSLKIDSKNIEKNRFIHKSLKAEHFGSIDFLASYNHFDTLNTYDATTVGVTLNIPLYSGGKISAQTQKATIATQIAKEQKYSNELKLKEELDNLLFDIQKYNEIIKAKKVQLSYAKQTKKVLDGRYKEGLSTYMEVLDATNLVLNAELGLLQTYYTKALSIDKITYLKGKI